MKNVLFICARNKLRSPTAEHVFSTWPNIETDSAGLNSDAEVQVSVEQLEWADLIFVMERTHKSKLSKKYRMHLKNTRVICLDIPDEYEYMDDRLVSLLEAKVGRLLR